MAKEITFVAIARIYQIKFRDFITPCNFFWNLYPDYRMKIKIV